MSDVLGFHAENVSVGRRRLGRILAWIVHEDELAQMVLEAEGSVWPGMTQAAKSSESPHIQVVSCSERDRSAS